MRAKEQQQRQLARRGLLGLGVARRRRAGRHTGNGQDEVELRAFAQARFKADAAARLFNHAFGDCQAQARALFLARIGNVAGREGAEQQMFDIGRNAQPGVGDAEAHALTIFGDIQADIDQAALGEFQGIVRELEERLAHLARIGGDARQVAAGAERQVQAFLPGARLQQPRHGARGLHRIAILVFQLVVIVPRQRDDIVDQGLQAFACLQHHLHMIGLLLGKLGAFQKLRHAQQRVQRGAQFMADVGDEGRFGHCAGLGAVARLYGFQLLALQPHDQHVVFVAQVNAFIQQARHAVAIACQHRGEQHDQDGGHGGVQPALPQQQADQRPQREEGMGDIGRAMGGAGDELRRRHAQIGQAQIGLGGKGIPDKPEHRRRAPGGAGNGRHKRVAPRPEMRVAAGRAVLVGGGELLGGDHHRHLQQQRHQRQDARFGAREQGGRHA
jgi:hypothetical protein